MGVPESIQEDPGGITEYRRLLMVQSIPANNSFQRVRSCKSGGVMWVWPGPLCPLCFYFHRSKRKQAIFVIIWRLLNSNSIGFIIFKVFNNNLDFPHLGNSLQFSFVKTMEVPESIQEDPGVLLSTKDLLCAENTLFALHIECNAACMIIEMLQYLELH